MQSPTWWFEITMLHIYNKSCFPCSLKYIVIDFHIIHEKVAKEHLDVRYIFTFDQIVDIMTRGLFLRLNVNFTTISLAGHVRDNDIYLSLTVNVISFKFLCLFKLKRFENSSIFEDTCNGRENYPVMRSLHLALLKVHKVLM